MPFRDMLCSTVPCIKNPSVWRRDHKLGDRFEPYRWLSRAGGHSRRRQGCRGPQAGLPQLLLPTGGLNRKLKYSLNLWSFLGRFPAKLGPKTPPDGPGSQTWSRTHLKSTQETNFNAIS